MPLDYDKLKEKKSRQSGRGWMPKDGTNIIRVLPHTSRYFSETFGEFSIEYDVHFLKLEGENKVTLCPRSENQFCPLCDVYWRHRRDENDPGLQKALTDIKPVDRHLINILDLNKTDAGIQAYEANYTVYNGVLDYVADQAWGDVLHPESGRNFHVILTPAQKSPTKRNSYSVMPAPQPSNIMQYMPQDWLARLDALPSTRPDALPLDELLAACRKLGLPNPELPRDLAMRHQVPVAAPPPPAPAAVPSYPAAPPPAAPYTAPPPPPPPAAPGVPSYGGAPAVPPPPPPPPPAPPAAPVAAPTPAPAPAPPPAAPAVAPAAVAAAGWPPTLVFEPGAQYPICYGKFDPTRYPCDFPCPVRIQCQMKAVGIGGAP